MIILIKVWDEHSSYSGQRTMLTRYFHNNTQSTKETSYYTDSFLEDHIKKIWTRTKNNIRIKDCGFREVIYEARHDAIEYLNPIYEKFINLMFNNKQPVIILENIIYHILNNEYMKYPEHIYQDKKLLIGIYQYSDKEVKLYRLEQQKRQLRKEIDKLRNQESEIQREIRFLETAIEKENRLLANQ
jgi:hypothetical protein